MDLVLVLKNFHFVVTPIGFIIGLTVTAILLYLINFKRASSGIMFMSLMLLWVSSTPWVAILAAKKLLSDAVIETPFKQLGEYDAIVVFSWLEPVKRNESDTNVYIDEKLERVKYLYQKRNVSIIVGSSQYPVVDNPVDDEITYTEQYLSNAGISTDDLFLAPPSRSSYEGVVATMRLLDTLDVRRIILVESDLRMPRKYLIMKKLYEKKNIQIVPYSNAEAQGFKSPNYRFDQWKPNHRALGLTTSVLHEWFGILAYRVVGWI